MFMALCVFSAAIFEAEGRAPARLCAGVLVLDLSESIVEGAGDAGAYAKLVEKESMGFHEACERLRAAAFDKNINALLICGSTDYALESLGVAAASELRRNIEKFKAAGKPVLAYLENPNLLDYFIASAAEEIIMNPASDMAVKGVSAQGMYFGNAFKKYGVGVEIVKAGAHKNFGDIFTKDKMPEEDKAHTKELIDGLWESVSSKIALSRGMGEGELSKIAEDVALLNAADTVKYRLADSLAYKDEVITRLCGIVGTDEDTGSFTQCALSKYAASAAAREAADCAFVKDESAAAEDADPALACEVPQAVAKSEKSGRVAVVYMQGDIIEGVASVGVIGSDTYSALLRQVRRDDNVSAVVLRVDSPGGSAYASEVIRREVGLLAAEKPVVVSVGGMAASGAYWISAPSNAIIAEEESIVGSIGVFGAFFNFEKFAGDFGVTFDGVKTHQYADIFSSVKGKTPGEISKLQRLVDETYGKFISIVSAGRNMEPKAAEKLADGRVHLAKKAKELGLVDEIGGLEDAVAKAAALAEISVKASDIMYLPQKQTFEEKLKELFSEEGYPFAKVYFGWASPQSILLERNFSRLKAIFGRNHICAYLFAGDLGT